MAINTTYDDIIDIAPELAKLPKARVKKFIDLAKLDIDESVWGAKATFATSLLTAHLLTMFSRKGNGTVKRKKIGNSEIEFQISGTGGSDNTVSYSETPYGKQFLQERKSLVTIPYLVC